MPDSCMVSATIGIKLYFGKVNNPCKSALPSKDMRWQGSGIQDTTDSRRCLLLAVPWASWLTLSEPGIFERPIWSLRCEEALGAHT